jgi:hypothetical protein
MLSFGMRCRTRPFCRGVGGNKRSGENGPTHHWKWYTDGSKLCQWNLRRPCTHIRWHSRPWFHYFGCQRPCTQSPHHKPISWWGNYRLHGLASEVPGFKSNWACLGYAAESHFSRHVQPTTVQELRHAIIKEWEQISLSQGPQAHQQHAAAMPGRNYCSRTPSGIKHPTPTISWFARFFLFHYVLSKMSSRTLFP